MLKVRLSLSHLELSHKDRILPTFLYRAFKGEPQDVIEVAIDNVNGYPVIFKLEEVSSLDGESLNGWMLAEEYDVLVDLMEETTQTLISHS